MKARLSTRLSRSTSRAKPHVRALVMAAYYRNGVPYVDVLPQQPGARIIPSVPVMELGGGGDAFLHFPASVKAMNRDPRAVDRTEAPLAVVEFDGDNNPVAIGFIPRPSVQASDGVGSTKEDGGSAKEPQEGHATNDFRMRLGDAELGVDSAGSWIVRPGKSGIVRIPLPSGGVLRVSHDGEATDKAAVATPIEDFAERISSIVNRTDARLAELIASMLLKAPEGPTGAAIASAAGLPYVADAVLVIPGQFSSSSVWVSAQTMTQPPIPGDQEA